MKFCPHRTLDLGRFVGIIFAIILLIDCVFFMVLEWWMPECDLDKVQKRWEDRGFKPEEIAAVKALFAGQ